MSITPAAANPAVMLIKNGKPIVDLPTVSIASASMNVPIHSAIAAAAFAFDVMSIPH
jgi:hypothetical protein